jgi:hypothetical protein
LVIIKPSEALNSSKQSINKIFCSLSKNITLLINNICLDNNKHYAVNNGTI